MNDALIHNNIQGLKLTPHAPAIHSLLSAGQATTQEALTIRNILMRFCNESGQTPNWRKSSIHFRANTPHNIKDTVNNIF